MVSVYIAFDGSCLLICIIGMPRTFLCGRALAQLLADKPLDDWFPPEFLVDHESRKSWWTDKSKL